MDKCFSVLQKTEIFVNGVNPLVPDVSYMLHDAFFGAMTRILA